MACEDFPCCGHEAGCCPDFDPETGKQLNMKCTCGATVDIRSRFSICEGCLNRGSDYDGEYYNHRPEPDEDEYDDRREQFLD